MASLIALAEWVDLRVLRAEILKAGWWLPAIVIWSLFQLFICGCAWRIIVGASSISRLAFFRLRVIREAINTLLPVAQIGGPISGALGMRQLGVSPGLASAGTIADVIVETGGQLVFTFTGLALSAAIGVRLGWVLVSAIGLASATFGILVIGAFQLQRPPLLVQRALAAASRTWLSSPHAQAVRDGFIQIRGRPTALARAAALHILAWSMSAVEVFIILTAIGSPTGLAQSFVIESLGAAARSAAFAIPGALGIQEVGLIFFAGLFGIPPEAAIALSMVKRLREIMIGAGGLILGEFSAIQHWLEPDSLGLRRLRRVPLVRSPPGLSDGFLSGIHQGTRVVNIMVSDSGDKSVTPEAKVSEL